MGVWREGAGWCFCSGGGGGRSERVKGAIFSAKSAALASISGGGCGGSGFLIHRNLLLTTHGNLPSAAAAEAAEILLGHGRVAARLVPHRFFITSSILDLTIVGLDSLENDSASQGQQQPHYFKTCCKPSLDHGSVVYLLGHTDKKELMIGEGKVVIGTDNLIKLSTDGVTWCPGSAGFDVQGNLAFMICDPMKLASSPTARSSSASSSPSHSWKKDLPTQFGIPIPVICDWLYQHWQGSLDEVSKPKLPLVRLMSSRSDHSSTSFTLRRIFKPAEDENDDASVSSQMASRPKYQQGSGSSANARISHDANPLVDLRTTNEQGIPTPEIYESPRPSSCQAQKKDNAPVQVLDINFPPRVPKTIFLPLPLKQMLSDENNAATSRPRNQLRENGFASGQMRPCNSEADSRNPPVVPHQEDCCSEVQSSSSPVEISEYGNEDRFSSEEETMYSAETMESRNIPSPREKQVGRSQSCVNYSRWSSPRSSSVQKAALRKQHTLIPVRKTHSQNTALPQRSHDYLSPTVSSAMKKRNSMEQEQPTRPRRSIVQASPRWMF